MTMTMTVQQWDVTQVRIDPENERLFTRMDDTELDLLAASIREVGIIQPLTIRSDGRIIAGEQRYRAALRAQLPTVPVIVREDITESEVETIRIHENLMRRGMKPSEQAKGIARLYELNGVKEGRPDSESGSSGTRKTVAQQIGWSVTSVKRYHTLSNLTPELAARWDRGEMTRDVAYQIAQLPPEQQGAIAALFGDSDKVPNLEKEIAEYKREIVRIQATEELPPSEREQRLQDELAKLRFAHQQEIDAMTFRIDDANRRRDAAQRRLDGVELWASKDAVHRTLGTLATLTSLDPDRYVKRLDGFDALTILLRSDLEIAEGVQDWLRRYAYALRERLEMPQPKLSEVKRVSFPETATNH
jgi:ParB/RepB/Spo0J family partition protein